MFNTDFVTVKQIHDRHVRDVQKRQATYRLSRELREQALAAAAATAKQPLLTRIAERLHLKHEAQETNDDTRAHAL